MRNSTASHTDNGPDAALVDAPPGRTTTVVRRYRFPDLPRTMLALISAGRQEAARVWMQCCELHQQARAQHCKWPGISELHVATRDMRYALHSQTVQQITRAFLGNVSTTRQLREAGERRARYPYKGSSQKTENKAR